MTDQTLGSVPSPYEMLPTDSALLPDAPSVLEVNGVGEVSAADVGLGDVTQGLAFGGDPFAFRSEVAPPMGNDPQSRLHMPTYGGPDGASGGTAGGGTYDPTTGAYTAPSGDSAGSSAPVAGLDSEQVANARTIEQVGRDVGASDRDIQIALMTALQESGLRNLDYGDRDSVGLFQQRDAWGSFEERTTPAASAKMFFTGGHGGQRGLLDVSDRDKMTLGQAAQAVQVSAYPDAYDKWESTASSLLGSGGGSYTPKDKSYIGPYDPSKLMERAQTLADAGGSDPFFGTESDHSYYRDCQHMVANLSGRPSSGYETASSAWSHFSSTGAAHPATGKDGQEPPVGAWLYYSGSSSAGHVAVYLGDGKVASTDVFGSGKVGVGDMKELTDGAWNLNYLGWAAPWGEGTPKAIAPKDKADQKPPPIDTSGGQGQSADPLGDLRQRVVDHAQKFLGTPFKWGGTDFTGVDNPGFIKSVYDHFGIPVPATTYGQAYVADHIPMLEVQPGDLLAWDKHPNSGAGHVAIYLGDSRLIEASHPGSVVQLNDLPMSAIGDMWGISLNSLSAPEVQPAHIAAPAPPPVAPVVRHPSTPTYPGSETYTPPAPTHTSTPAPPEVNHAHIPAPSQPTHHTTHHHSSSSGGNPNYDGTSPTG